MSGMSASPRASFPKIGGERDPKAHPTRWTVVLRSKLSTGSQCTLVFDFETQAEAEAELVRSRPDGHRGYVLPPVRALARTA